MGNDWIWTGYVLHGAFKGDKDCYSELFIMRQEQTSSDLQ